MLKVGDKISVIRIWDYDLSSHKFPIEGIIREIQVDSILREPPYRVTIEEEDGNTEVRIIPQYLVNKSEDGDIIRF